MDCPHCGTAVGDDSNFCPSCGSELQVPDQTQTGSTHQSKRTAEAASKQAAAAASDGSTQGGDDTAEWLDDSSQSSNATAAATPSLPLLSGVVFGALAYVLNLAMTYGLFSYEMQDVSSTLSGGVEKYELAGWLLYGGHTVSLVRPDGTTFNYLDILYQGPAMVMAVPKMAYFAVPVLGLFWAGWIVSGRVAKHPGRVSTKSVVL